MVNMEIVLAYTRYGVHGHFKLNMYLTVNILS